jgi:hypothetical protein
MKDPEDEAFEELSLKQGQWEHTSGWRKKQILETSMTQDDIIRMAQEAGPLISTPFDVWCERFASLVRADEREACAKICEDLHPGLATRVAAEHIRSRKWL